MRISRFNLRVYFILKHPDSDLILLSDEIIAGKPYTKFPGGGLEFGEGPEDCARREAMEELGQAIRIDRHYYTTGHFQPSAFRESDQVIAIYYMVSLLDALGFSVAERKFAFHTGAEGEQCLRWVEVQNIAESMFDFPIDKMVAAMIREEYQ